MGKLRELSKRWEKVEKGQKDELIKIIQRHNKVILTLNKQQLFAGRDAMGRKLAKYKSKSYARYKMKLNPQGVTDLYLHGKFYDGMFVKTFFPIVIDSKDGKRNKLVGRYGKGLFGLDRTSKKIFAKGYVREGLLKYYRKILHV